VHKIPLLCCAVLVACGAGWTQSDVDRGIFTLAASAPSTASTAAAMPDPPQVLSRLDLTDWQVAYTYRFNQVFLPEQLGKNAEVPAFTANDNGYGISLTRFLVNWGGLEADAAFGFGGTSTSQIRVSKFLRVVGGPHFALRGHGRVEPWAHALVGLAHFRFSQTATAYGSNTSLAFLGGIGADFHLNPRTALRVQGDYVGTALFKEPQTSWGVGAGIVLNF
jgi:hypothetical protein